MNNKPLYIWWISTLLMLSGLFWSGYSGIITEVWQNDHTYLTSIIMIIYGYTAILLGYLAFNIKNLSKPIIEKISNRAFFLSEIVMGIAIFGASLAIIMLLGITTGFATADMQKFLLEKWGELAPAFYPNAVGLIVSVIIKFQTYFIVEDHLDASE